MNDAGDRIDTSAPSLVGQLPGCQIEGVVTAAGLARIHSSLRHGQSATVAFEGVARDTDGTEVDLYRVTVGPLLVPLERIIQLVGPPRRAELLEAAPKGGSSPALGVETQEALEQLRGAVKSVEGMTRSIGRDGSKRCAKCAELDYNCGCPEPEWQASGEPIADVKSEALEGPVTAEPVEGLTEDTPDRPVPLEEILGRRLSICAEGQVWIRCRCRLETGCMECSPRDPASGRPGWVRLLAAVEEGWTEAFEEAERLDELVGGAWRRGLLVSEERDEASPAEFRDRGQLVI